MEVSKPRLSRPANIPQTSFFGGTHIGYTDFPFFRSEAQAVA
ncbi:hypothetical protein [Paraburkholderia heleia]|nr:hypothetical protein [Paraburkholderia heleia]